MSVKIIKSVALAVNSTASSMPVNRHSRWQASFALADGSPLRRAMTVKEKNYPSLWNFTGLKSLSRFIGSSFSCYPRLQAKQLKVNDRNKGEGFLSIRTWPKGIFHPLQPQDHFFDR